MARYTKWKTVWKIHNSSLSIAQPYQLVEMANLKLILKKHQPEENVELLMHIFLVMFFF